MKNWRLKEDKYLSIFSNDKFKQIEVDDYEITVVGDVQLSSDEIKTLKLHPKFAIMASLDDNEIEFDDVDSSNDSDDANDIDEI